MRDIKRQPLGYSRTREALRKGLQLGKDFLSLLWCQLAVYGMRMSFPETISIYVSGTYRDPSRVP
jgi:hypothetical protein